MFGQIAYYFDWLTDRFQ